MKGCLVKPDTISPGRGASASRFLVGVEVKGAEKALALFIVEVIEDLVVRHLHWPCSGSQHLMHCRTGGTVELTMLGSPSQDTGKRGWIPDRFDGGVLSLASLESEQSLGMVRLNDLDLLHFHLDIMKFLVERRETRIHAKTD